MKKRSAAIVHENVTNCLETTWNNAYNTIKKPSARYRFLIRSVSKFNLNFFQLSTLAEMKAIRANEKLTPSIDFPYKR